ncbi:MAG: nitroreductase [Cohaesibacter sp.]|nr:nitroreductase [Cohaesibacter sp.]
MSDLMDHLLSRRTLPAAFLGEPAPTSEQLERILTAAVRAPDHKKLEPWRLIVFTPKGCERMGALLKARWQELDPQADEARLTQETERFLRAPMVIGVVSSLKDTSRAPEWEQILSAGAVCMNLIHAAHGEGYSAQWLTEWCAFDEAILAELGLGEGERLAGFIHIGTPQAPKTERTRPDLSKIVQSWGE